MLFGSRGSLPEHKTPGNEQRMQPKAVMPGDDISSSGASFERQETGSVIDYTVRILQEPIQARMSGLTNTASRRMLDPPLVLKVDFKDEFDSPDVEKEKRNLSMELVCLVELVDSTGKSQSFAFTEHDNHCMLTKSSGRYVGIDQTKVLTLLLGQTARSCSYMNLSETEKSLLFIFSDLSIRVQGHYKISCTVVHLRSGRIDKLQTELFQVYTPQFYPGLLPPTSLTKWLYLQGVQLRSGFHSAKAKAEIMTVDDEVSVELQPDHTPNLTPTPSSSTTPATINFESLRNEQQHR